MEIVIMAFEPKNFKNQKHSENKLSDKKKDRILNSFFIIFTILILTLIASMFGVFSKDYKYYENPKMKEDYYMLKEKEYLGEYELVQTNNYYLSRFISNKNVYYLFNYINSEQISDSCYVDESICSITQGNKNTISIYKETYSHYKYNILTRDYNVLEEIYYFYEFQLTNYNINDLGSINLEQQSNNMVIFPFVPYFNMPIG